MASNKAVLICRGVAPCTFFWNAKSGSIKLCRKALIRSNCTRSLSLSAPAKPLGDLSNGRFQAAPLMPQVYT